MRERTLSYSSPTHLIHQQHFLKQLSKSLPTHNSTSLHEDDNSQCVHKPINNHLKGVKTLQSQKHINEK